MCGGLPLIGESERDPSRSLTPWPRAPLGAMCFLHIFTRFPRDAENLHDGQRDCLAAPRAPDSLPGLRSLTAPSPPGMGIRNWVIVRSSQGGDHPSEGASGK